jgi:hypothetical protein
MFYCEGQNITNVQCYSDSFISVRNEEENIFDEPTIEASFKGGVHLWSKFLIGNVSWQNIIRFIPDTMKYFEDSVVLKFVVSREGRISNLKVLYSGFESIKMEAIRLIILSCPKWNPPYSSAGGPINSWRKVKLYFLWDNRNDKLVTRIGEIYR